MNIEQAVNELIHRFSTWQQMLDVLKEIEDYLIFTDQSRIAENITKAIKAAEKKE